MRCYLVRHAQTTWNGENRLQGHADQPLNAFGLLQARRVGGYFAALRAQGRAPIGARHFLGRRSSDRRHFLAGNDRTGSVASEDRTGSVSRAPIGARHFLASEDRTGSVSSTPTIIYTSHLQRSRQTADAIARSTGLPVQIEPSLAEISLGAWEGLTPEEIDAQFAGGYERWTRAPSDVSIPGGEPTERFHQRVHEAFERIAEAHRDHGLQDVIVVTHGGVIASLLAAWLDADYDRFLRRVALENTGVSAVDCRHHPPSVLWVNATSHLNRD